MSDPAERVMLIAGGTGSVGRAVATRALAAGWRVALHGRSEASAEDAAAALGGGDRVRGFAADMLIADAMTRLVAQAADWGGRIDAVVDAVSGGDPTWRVAGRFAETEPDGFAPLLAHSLVHLERLAHAALPWLKRQGGTLIAFASDAGRFAAPRQALIAGSRGGIMAFARSLAMEVARDGVRVHCVSPSFIDESRALARLSPTGLERLETARRKAGLGLPTPDDIAPLVLFLCSDDARRITGQVISVNGGMNA